MTHPEPTIRGRNRPSKLRGAAPKSGARALSRHMAANNLDQRTWVARLLREVRQELADDAGGWEHLTAGERLLIERCAAQALICSTIEAHIFTKADRLVDDAGELLPILRRGYVSHVQSLSRMLQALGLRRERPDGAGTSCGQCGVAFRGPDALHAYLAHRSQCGTGNAPANAAPPVDGERSTADVDAPAPAACSQEPRP